MLEVSNLHKSFHGHVVACGLGYRFLPGKVYGIIGSNGAGKTTFLNIVNGLLVPDHGKVLLKGKEVTGLKADRIANLGVGRLFQETRIFPALSVRDNLLLGSRFFKEENPVISLLNYIENRKKEDGVIQSAQKILRQLRMPGDRLLTSASNLSYGQEKLVSLARLLIGKYDVYLLDEPVSGLQPAAKHVVYKAIEALKEQGCLIIVVEHEMEAIQQVCDEVIFMSEGKFLKSGTAVEILNDKKIIEEYMGLRVPDSKEEVASTTHPLMNSDIVLSCKDISATYYKRVILKGLSMDLERGDINGLIGPNGAGKSTLLKVIIGILGSKEGKIFFHNRNEIQDITKWGTRKRIINGISYLDQKPLVFPDLTVEEHLRFVQYDLRNRNAITDKLLQMFPILKDKLSFRAGVLSGGEKRILYLCMVLAMNSKLLLLDEPSACLAPKLADDVLDKVVRLSREQGSSMLIVEQRIGKLLRIVDSLFVMKDGVIVKNYHTQDSIDLEEIMGIYMGAEDKAGCFKA